ncbi:LIM domain-binding protein 3-like [Bactrocera neohumeralis]|uniref:LIM domain-binding protein 3-like n=1 Tax=Bactrocera neohumeralis TaxID=98809 RepID=UPI00216533F0|nr:LIM domain-binding protein 3-like [Bactrocera neohumeralis]
MDNQHMRIKTERTTQEQLQHYIMFCKQHPESLMHCKHQLRSRARKLKAHAQATGGGPPINGMSKFEEQAISTFGAAAVDGLPGVTTLGHQVLALYLNTVTSPAPAPTPTVTSPDPALTPTVTSPAPAPTTIVASAAPASSPAVTSPAPAFPALTLNFSSSPSPHFSSSPSP